MTIQKQNTQPLSLEEAADYLDLSKSYLYKLTSAQQIQHFKSQGGKRVYFRREDLDDWAYARRVTPQDEIDQQAAEYVAAAA